MQNVGARFAVHTDSDNKEVRIAVAAGVVLAGDSGAPWQSARVLMRGTVGVISLRTASLARSVPRIWMTQWFGNMVGHDWAATRCATSFPGPTAYDPRPAYDSGPASVARRGGERAACLWCRRDRGDARVSALCVHACALHRDVGHQRVHCGRLCPGIQHPPGNPFFVLLGHVFTLLPIAPTIAQRVNVMAALTSAASAGIWFLVAERVLAGWLSSRWLRMVGALAAVLIGATTFTVWDQSIVNEKVYTISLSVLCDRGVAHGALVG